MILIKIKKNISRSGARKLCKVLSFDTEMDIVAMTTGFQAYER